MCKSLVVTSGPPLVYSNLFAIGWELETKWPLFQRLVCLFILFQMAVGYDSSNMFPRDKVKNGFMVSLFTLPLDITSFCHLLNTKLGAQT